VRTPGPEFPLKIEEEARTFQSVTDIIKSLALLEGYAIAMPENSKT
jgi:hypothetical protein